MQEGLVAQSSVQETSEPVASNLSAGIVTVVGHVRGIEDPFRNKTGSNVRSKLSSGNDILSTGLVKTYGIKNDRGIVLADIGAVVTEEVSITNTGDILLVNLPLQTLSLQKIIDGADIGGDVIVSIIGDTEIGTSSSSDIVWLRRMGNSIGVVKKDTLFSNLLINGKSGGSLVISILEPDLHETLEDRR